MIFIISRLVYLKYIMTYNKVGFSGSYLGL